MALSGSVFNHCRICQILAMKSMNRSIWLALKVAGLPDGKYEQFPLTLFHDAFQTEHRQGVSLSSSCLVNSILE